MSQETNKQYTNESVIHTMKVIEALEGLGFEPVPIKTVLDRVEMPPGFKPLTYDKVMRVLVTLELIGWTQRNEKKQWSLTARIIRYAERYSEIYIGTL